jgi:hypothetical protein
MWSLIYPSSTVHLNLTSPKPLFGEKASNTFEPSSQTSAGWMLQRFEWCERSRFLGTLTDLSTAKELLACHEVIHPES